MEKQKVLIVDDTPQNIHVLMETLKDSYKIVAATSGAKALQLATREPLPDLILLDVMMPEMSGYEVCEQLKKNPVTEKIPVIFVTALHEAGDEEKGLELGALDFITKPFHPALVKARVRNQLELKRHRDHLEEEVQRRTQELLASNLARQKLENELDVARGLQRSMLANDRFSLPGHSGGGLAALLRPARAVGGDLYDYALLEPNKLLLVMGDVSDKGVAAALFMVRALTLLRSFAPSVANPGELLSLVNIALCRDNDTFMFVTLACCVVDLETLSWQYSSGGHEPPLILGSGAPHFLELESGPALGLLDEAAFPIHEGQLAPGSTFLMYTDGVTEAEDSTQACYGPERLLKATVGLADADPGDLVEGISADVRDFVGLFEQSDDLTMLALKAPGGKQ
jgi:sigma-B regulation protein RsbU (phosphoserine phosphatase)